MKLIYFTFFEIVFIFQVQYYIQIETSNTGLWTVDRRLYWWHHRTHEADRQVLCDRMAHHKLCRDFPQSRAQRNMAQQVQRVGKIISCLFNKHNTHIFLLSLCLDSVNSIISVSLLYVLLYWIYFSGKVCKWVVCLH